MSFSQVAGGFWMQLPGLLVPSFRHVDKAHIELWSDARPVMADGTVPEFRWEVHIGATREVQRPASSCGGPPLGKAGESAHPQTPQQAPGGSSEPSSWLPFPKPRPSRCRPLTVAPAPRRPSAAGRRSRYEKDEARPGVWYAVFLPRPGGGAGLSGGWRGFAIDQVRGRPVWPAADARPSGLLVSGP
jgi:hypothetical protein